MKSIKAAVILAAILAVVPCVAQNRSLFAGVADAFDFAYGQNPGSPALLVTSGCTTTGVCTLTLAYGQTVTGSGIKFNPLATNAPISIGEGSNYETVTPSSVSCSTPAVQYTCQFTATFAGIHGPGSYVRSGSYGLAEAVNYQHTNANGGVVMIGPAFIAAGGTTSTVTGTSGWANAPIVQNIGTASGSAFSYKSTGTSSPAAYTVTTVSWY